MHSISGLLNVYYPFELKDCPRLNHITKLYDKVRDSQIKLARYNHRPRTDLMDCEDLRRQTERVVALTQEMMGGVMELGCEPYATSRIAKAFRYSREDNYFVTEASVILSHFGVLCPGVNTQADPMEGHLLYFVDLSNHVGTYLLSLRFEQKTVDEVIRLKHVFYKRALAYIAEVPVQSKLPQNLLFPTNPMSFPEYVSEKSKGLRHYKYRQRDIDFRARYTFLEIDDHKFGDNELHGLLAANEKYAFLRDTCKSPKNHSEEVTYSLYYNLRSALLVNHFPYSCTQQKQKEIFQKCQFYNHHIATEFLEPDDMIAGLARNKFPKFLKTVELHLLTNNIQRHENVRHQLSYWNPVLIVKRIYQIWKVLYGLDINHCYIDNRMKESFGVNDNLNELRIEYKQLTGHILNYCMLAVSVLALFLSIFK